MVAARGWAGLFNGFGGKSSKKIDPIEFLPFPDEFRSPYKISIETARALLKLCKNGSIKMRYVSSLSTLIEEALEIEKKFGK